MFQLYECTKATRAYAKQPPIPTTTPNPHTAAAAGAVARHSGTLF